MSVCGGGSDLTSWLRRIVCQGTVVAVYFPHMKTFSHRRHPSFTNSRDHGHADTLRTLMRDRFLWVFDPLDRQVETGSKYLTV